MRSERPELTNHRGQRLAARLDMPVSGRAASCALIAHCFTCSKDLKALGTIAEQLTHAGIGVIRLDFTGLGQSDGEFSETTFSSDVSDLVAAAEQIEEQYGPVELMVGHSLGGAAAILATEQLDKVRAVATIGAPSEPVHVRDYLEGDLEELVDEGEAVVEIGGRPFKVRREFLEDLETTHLDDALAELGRPLLIMHAPDDEVVGIDHASQIFKAARHPRSFIALDDADHLLSRSADAAYAGRLIASWASRYIDIESVDDWRDDVDAPQNIARTERELRTEIVANGFRLAADEPAELGGTDTAPNPHDYLSAALASCTTMTLRMYADRKDWPMEAATANVDHQKVEPDDADPYDRFVCTIELEGDLDPQQRERMLEIASRCPVHRTLASRADVQTELAD